MESIKQLYKAGKINECYSALQNYLIYNPKDLTAIKLLQKVKTEILKANITKIEEAIKRFDHLWKQKKYPELLQAYLEIQKFAPDYKPLQKKIEKVYKILQKSSQNEYLNQFNEINQIVKVKISNNELLESIKFVEHAFIKNPNNPLIKKLVLDTKRKVIDIKLNQNKSSIKGNNIPKIYDFIKSLYELEPTYEKIQKMLIKYHSLLKKYYENQKYVFEKDAMLQIKVLYNKNEYQKCLQACNELIRTTVYNKFAFKYKKKAEQGIINENFATSYQKLNLYLNKLQQDNQTQQV